MATRDARNNSMTMIIAAVAAILAILVILYVVAEAMQPGYDATNTSGYDGSDGMVSSSYQTSFSSSMYSSTSSY